MISTKPATQILGLGFCPAGLSYHGFGSPATGVMFPSSIYQQSNNQYGNARFIDPVTQDYVFAANGSLSGMSDIQQSVYLAIITSLGSSADPNLGTQISSVEVIGSSTISDIQNYVSTSIASLINSQSIYLNSVNVVQSDANHNRLGISISWTDATTNKSYNTVV